jgi:hypothetical protein
MRHPSVINTPECITMVTYLGLDSGRCIRNLPLFLRSFPLPPIRALLHMDNALSTVSGLALIGTKVYGRSTPFAQVYRFFPRLAHEAGDEKAVGCIFPWRAPDHGFRIIR